MKKKLSLCVIAGNVENIIGRFLDAFGPVADEVIVVQAVGNQTFDTSLKIASERGCRVSVYYNQGHPAHGPDKWDKDGERKDWPHVDDFAAARNMACDMATGDWLMWADTDDLISEESIKQIRRLIEDIDDKPCDGVLMRYVIPEDGVVNWRERLWRRGKARWENPVHECLKFEDGCQSIRFDGAEIVHASEKRTAARDERNLRILETIPENERTVSQRFHVFQSLIALDRNEEAITRAIEFTQLPDAGKNELYEAFFQLARLAGDEDMKKAMLIQSLATDPSRREAFGELALACLPNEPEKSIAYTVAMNALTIPREAPWNLRRAYYGQLGVSLHAMALRRNGRTEEADAYETNHFIRHGAKISLLHATRGRPGKAWKARQDWLRMAHNPDAIEHIFGVDSDDPESFLLLAARAVVVRGNGGPVDAWNECAKFAKGEILIQLSDDFAPFPGWDTAVIDAIGDASKPAVLAVSDGNRADDLLCMAILTRTRYQEQGFMFHPEFFSMFSDNWFSECAFRDGVVIDARDRITFEHLHPAFGKAEMDATYARSNASANYQAGRGLFTRLQQGIRRPSEIEGWCDYAAFYNAIADVLPNGGAFAEVGSWMGQSAVVLCQRLQDIEKAATVHCIDTFEGEQNQPAHVEIVKNMGGSTFGKFCENIEAAGVSDLIKVTTGDSAESASLFEDESLDGVFIDAAHDYESVVKDVAAWFPKVKQGGIFSGHDYPCPDVRRAVDEHAAANGYKVIAIGRCWIRVKEEQYEKTSLAIMAHESAQPTVDLFLPKWKELDCDLYCSIPEGDEIKGFERVLRLGKSAYSGRDVFHRFTATLGAMIETGADRIVIAEYDTVNLRPQFPIITKGSVMSCFVSDGDQVCALSPWAMDADTAKQLHAACVIALDDGDYPEGNGLLDRWIGNVIRRAEIHGCNSSDCIGYPWKDGTRERIQAECINWIHGWKTKEEFGGLL